ncbi:MAG TPA: vitamin B12-dependent ribonucleotide reductase [Terriglobales bacterium]|nr:vitamin B12-dependent ribonucleotide reductase [Terriglobales bacterium]
MSEVTEKKAPQTAETGVRPASVPSKKAPGLSFRRFFTKPGVSPYDDIEWERRTAQITDAHGNLIFEQKEVEVPKDWSMTATNIVASKYLHGTLHTSARETGVRQLVSRVAETIRDWGLAQGYFKTPEDGAIWHDELAHMLLRQYGAFNSPVWFNVGCDRIEPNSDAQNWHWNAAQGRVEFGMTGYEKPQCSACFINSVKDSLDSILTLAKTEGMLFKWGSGTGTNLSTLRSSTETLSGGGIASGPLSFMKGFDAFAGVIKSGGKTRRAAKMVILNIDHPDIVDFIECKSKEEAKAHALVAMGYDGSHPDSAAYSSIFFQNANNSVRVSDDFMRAVLRDADFATRAIKDGRPMHTYKAKELLYKISDATWRCGDPGMQFDTTINRWHTSKNTARINASNPCSEYVFLDDSACNLASLNLLKFAPNGSFDVDAYRHAVDVMITAQEILVDNAGYPTEMIVRNSHDYRPLGLGYANLGALLMAAGLPYDSDAGRDYAACLTAIMCGEAYLQSSKIAELCPPLIPANEASQRGEDSGTMPGGAAVGWYINREPFLDVIRMHRASVNNINKTNIPASLYEASKACWDDALAHGEKFGYRNSQVTVLAPTGTIGFMMDCDTTGVEPDLALVKYKKLVGGGMIKIVNNTVPTALFKLGYSHEETDKIVSYIDATGTIEGAPQIREEHLAVFDCSFKPAKGTRSIHHMGHLKMMAAVQPFISGAISKTVNLPESASIEDIVEAYIEAWKLGLKAVAIYRDGCKKSQPLSAAGTKTAAAPGEETRSPQVAAEPENFNAPPRAVRHKLPEERMSVTHKFNVGGHEGYITVGLYPSGDPGEIFITMAKEGSTVSGLMDSFACGVSIALQHGVPLKLLCEKFAHTRFEPSGWSNNPEIGFAKSIMDYIFRWLHMRFLTGQQQLLFENLRPKPSAVSQPAEMGDLSNAGPRPTPGSLHAADALAGVVDMGDAPTCSFCGSIMTRNGSCYRCMSCGSTSGCS